MVRNQEEPRLCCSIDTGEIQIVRDAGYFERYNAATMKWAKERGIPENDPILKEMLHKVE